MADTVEKVLMGIYFYPRGGSAHSARALARQLEVQGLDVTLLSGSRTDLGPLADAQAFYDGVDVRSVDFTPALRSAQPLDFVGPACTAPIHGSFEDRTDAPDAVLTSLDDDRFELQVEAWAEELERAAAGGVDRLYLHHLTPVNEAAARALPRVPIIGHIHGTELLMLEEIEAGPAPGRRIVVGAPPPLGCRLRATGRRGREGRRAGGAAPRSRATERSALRSPSRRVSDASADSPWLRGFGHGTRGTHSTHLPAGSSG